jgi:protein ImuB
MIITAVNAHAEAHGIIKGMGLADARVTINGLLHYDDIPQRAEKLLHGMAEWCIRFTPSAAVDGTDGLLLDVSGCSHLWGGDEKYLTEIVKRLKTHGYTARAAMAGTIGVAWAVARFSKKAFVISENNQMEALLSLPAECMRIEQEIIERLYRLGLRQVKDFIGMSRTALRRRFGPLIIKRINQAAGFEEEFIQPVQPVEPYQERLPCLEPITTITGIEFALKQLLAALCTRLGNERKGLRLATLKCYRVDGNIQQVIIGTITPSSVVKHLFQLFEDKLTAIEPDLGIELFILEAGKVEDQNIQQQQLWQRHGGLDNGDLAQLLDRIADKMGPDCIHRYLPAEHYWPERSIQLATAVNEQLLTPWKLDRPRPIQLLPIPERIEVTAPIPDYPPMNFRYQNKLHKIIRSDGPERIEQEWWLQEGEHRDYYMVEDEEGSRYWLFRSGHYTGDRSHRWFLHGFFA